MKQPQRPRRPARAGATGLSRRKLAHLDACLSDEVDQRRDSFARWKLRYNALPEIALEDVSTAGEFAGRAIAAPIIISCMTGGSGKRFRAINRNLALGAQALGIPLGLGSMKVMLSQPDAAASFAVRGLMPDAPLIANLGLVSFNHGLDFADMERILEAVRPDAFGLHLNALQEAVQEGGDTDFRGLERLLADLVRRCPVPVFVKECGGGLAPEVVRRLAGAGARYIDISGSDGTSWAAVEARLSADPSLGELFRDFGLPTAWVLERLGPEHTGSAAIIAGGGIRDGLQAAKAIALGARYVSVARPFLLAAEHSPERVIALGRRLIRELRTAMFLVGVKRVEGLTRDLLVDAR
jgi:isopentenyl-diphosphate delta-isomerase